MPESYDRKLMHEYFFKRLSELDDEQRRLIAAMRTKTGLVILCDKLRATEIEKRVVTDIYEEMKHLF